MIEILDMPQGSQAWFDARLGRPTASGFKDIMAKGKGLVRKGYMMRLAAELITGEVQEKFQNLRMRKGKELEPEARDLYAYLRECEPQLIGMFRNDVAAYSPDGVIGDDGLLEIKTLEPPLLVELLASGKIPSEHKPQLQGGLWVSGRYWIDFVGYWPEMPLFCQRVERDQDYIEELAAEVRRFADELRELVERVRQVNTPRGTLAGMLQASLAAL